jgi:tetratricopeptide (TPR) repeat protein
MTEALPLNIFVATPSDLQEEREAVKRVVAEWNLRHGTAGVQFEVIGWERTRGTARRAQGAINELISESHFMLVIFKERWGSEPGSSWGYTSGTEEELFQGLLELGQADQLMRDVWVAFAPAADPDPAVVALKQQIIDRHVMLFESLTDIADLTNKLTARLEGWATNFATKRARHVELVSSTGSEMLRAARLRIEGEKLVELGQSEAGQASLEQSAKFGGPREQLAYARQLARKGALDKAYAATQIAIQQARQADGGLFSTTAAEAFAAQAGVLRRQGSNIDAIGRFQQALTLVPDEDPDASRVSCRILDEIGLAWKAQGDTVRAKVAFDGSLSKRRAVGRPYEVSQSLINLARLAVEEHDLGEARTYSDEALSLLDGVAPTALHANAETLAAQLRLRQGAPAEGIGHATRARALNQQFGSANGEAIALLVLAQCYRAVGELVRAAASARSCLEINERIGNDGGRNRAQWQLNAILKAK